MSDSQEKPHGNKGRVPWNKDRKATEKERQAIKDSHWTKKPHEETLEIRKAISENGTRVMTKVNADGKAFRMPKGYHTEEHKQYMRELLTGRNVTWNDKIKESHWSNKSHEEVQDIVARIMDKRGPMRNQYEQDWRTSIKTGEEMFYLSSYERRRMEHLDVDERVSTFTNRHGIRLTYELDGELHTYIPDLLVTYDDGSIVLEEVKGYVQDERVFAAKNAAAIEYCSEHGWNFRVVYEKDLAI